jgi:hypothetical protein
MTGEHVNHLALLQNQDQLVKDLTDPGFLPVSDEQRNQLLQYVNQSGSLKKEQAFLETSFPQLLSARQEAFPGRLQAGKLIQQRAAEAAAQGLLLNHLYWDGLSGVVNREGICLADLRLATTALALEQYRVAHDNQYPASLSELTPTYLKAAPADPFDGQPLRYRQQGAGYVLYSIGPGLRDNGGKRLTSNGGDRVFAVVTPPLP